MNKLIVGIVVGLVLGAVGAAGFLMWRGQLGLAFQGRDTPAAEGQAEEQAGESFLQQDAEGRTLVKLDQETQTRVGLKGQSLTAVQMSPEVKGYGRVLDPTPLMGLVTEAASTQAALQASSKEYERLKTLYRQNQNASARSLEAAEAAMAKDRISLESVQSRLLLGWGRAVASQADLPAFARSLVAQETLLLRVDFPLGKDLPASPNGGRIAPMGEPERLSEAQYLGPAPIADPQMQSRGILLLVKAAALPPGTAVLAWLTVPGQAQSGVIVPRGAVLRHERRTFVYVQTAADTFERKAVMLEHPAGDGWFVGEDFGPQDRVVVVGAQELLSEELKGQGGGEE